MSNKKRKLQIFEAGSQEEEEYLETLDNEEHSEYIKKRDGLKGTKRKTPLWLHLGESPTDKSQQ